MKKKLQTKFYGSQTASLVMKESNLKLKHLNLKETNFHNLAAAKTT